MSAEGYAYVAGGAGTEETMRENRAAFERWRIVPRMLRDVSTRDTAVEVLGTPLPSPFVLCPIGVLEMAHRDADVAVARAAAAEGIPFVFSNQASRPMEETARAMGDAPRWFQLYWSTSNELVASLVSRAERCGCSAIVLTLDTTMLGWRIRDLDLAYLPVPPREGDRAVHERPGLRRGAPGDAAPGGAARRVAITLAAIGTLLEPGRRVSGIAARERALRPRASRRPPLRRDVLASVALVGRSRVPPRADAAADPAEGDPPPRRRARGGRARHGRDRRLEPRRPPGRRRDRDDGRAARDRRGRRPAASRSCSTAASAPGADVFRALALGASAVGLGRPYVWGLAAGGEEGVREVIRNLRADFDLTMGLSRRRVGARTSGARTSRARERRSRPSSSTSTACSSTPITSGTRCAKGSRASAAGAGPTARRRT